VFGQGNRQKQTRPQKPRRDKELQTDPHSKQDEKFQKKSGNGRREKRRAFRSEKKEVDWGCPKGAKEERNAESKKGVNLKFTFAMKGGALFREE